MQTFLPFQDYNASAASLDMMRLGKQRVEAYQILQNLLGERLVTSELVLVKKTVSISPEGTPKDEMEWEEVELVRRLPLERHEWYRESIKTAGWDHHPAVLMWKGFELELLNYEKAICGEWASRGYSDSCLEKCEFLIKPHRQRLVEGKPTWLGNEDFHRSHRSNLLRKDENFYRKVFPTDPADLPYLWPTKDLDNT